MIISHVDITVYIAYFYIDINDYSGVKVSQCEYAKVLMSCRVTVGRGPRIDWFTSSSLGCLPLRLTDLARAHDVYLPTGLTGLCVLGW